MPFALTKDKRSRRQFFKVHNDGQFTLSVDNARLSFFMDPTSELFILSSKGWPREREQENIIDCSVNLLYFYLQPGRARRQSYNYELCDDGLDLQQAAATCPFQFIPKCKVEYLSCAWLVNCPGLMGNTFRKRISADRFIQNNQRFSLKSEDGKKVECLPTHLEYSLVCCGYYCNALKLWRKIVNDMNTLVHYIDANEMKCQWIKDLTASDLDHLCWFSLHEHTKENGEEYDKPAAVFSVFSELDSNT